MNLYSALQPQPREKRKIWKSMLPRRLEVIKNHANWILKNEEFALKHFADGKDIVPQMIEPVLEECKTEEQMALWRYARYTGSIPYSEYVGRRLRFLIRDRSLPNRPVMGIAALGSSIMQLKDRDEWIGWYDIEKRNIKQEKIAAMMDLYVSIPIPPYSYLLAGKLICYMMLSNEIRRAYKRKYANKLTLIKKRKNTNLVLLSTTSLYGKRSSQYNRIKYDGKLAYIPVGETAGFGSLYVTDEEFQKMRETLEEAELNVGHNFGEGANWRMRVIREYYDKISHIDSDDILNHGFKRGVFVAPLASNAREFLLGKVKRPKYYDWPMEALITYWRNRWLLQRAQNIEIMNSVRKFKKESIVVSKLIYPQA